jgi:SAM-dependent methyltransferase
MPAPLRPDTAGPAVAAEPPPARLFERVVDLILRAIDSGVVPGRLQKALWRRCYQTLNRRWPDQTWTFLNYGYVPGPGEAARPLKAGDEKHRLFIQLYDRALAGIPVAGRRVLEVGCGRGGGASFIARYLAPAAVTGLDLSADGIELCRRVHAGVAGLAFRQGDAEAMPIPSGSVDVVVNVESSHCYPDMARFLAEVARVLAPGGHFAWADLRGRGMLAGTDRAFAGCGLRPLAGDDITANVVEALDRIDDLKRSLIRQVPMHQGFLSQFGGTRGSLIHQAFVHGYARYLTRNFVKA